MKKEKREEKKRKESREASERRVSNPLADLPRGPWKRRDPVTSVSASFQRGIAANSPFIVFQTRHGNPRAVPSRVRVYT